MKTKFYKRLKKLNACKEALVWLGDRTPKQTLAECDRGDWLLWWFWHERNTEGFPDIRKITLAKARCAKLVIHLMKDQRSIDAVMAAERYGLGEIDDDELSVIITAAYDAAAYAAAYAAIPASAAYTIANEVANAASAADARTDARNKVLKQCADVCRQIFWIPENYCKEDKE